MIDIDPKDAEILTVLQRDGNLSQRELADRVGLSQNALWRRLKRLTEAGVIQGYGARIDPVAVGLDLTVFVLARTRHHDKAWAERFRRHVESIPEVVELHRIGGEWDYLLKLTTTSMAGYDRVYQRLIEKVELETVSGLFSMETILAGRPLAVPR